MGAAPHLGARTVGIGVGRGTLDDVGATIIVKAGVARLGLPYGPVGTAVLAWEPHVSAKQRLPAERRPGADGVFAIESFAATMGATLTLAAADTAGRGTAIELYELLDPNGATS